MLSLSPSSRVRGSSYPVHPCLDGDPSLPDELQDNSVTGSLGDLVGLYRCKPKNRSNLSTLSTVVFTRSGPFTKEVGWWGSFRGRPSLDPH